jgi:hypothetical protein
MVRERYPTPAAYEKDIPNLLIGLGFPQERASTLADNSHARGQDAAAHAGGSRRHGLQGL